MTNPNPQNYDFNEVLIAEIKKYEAIYNSNKVNYRDSSQTRNAWEEVARTVGKTSDECKRRWNCLRDSFRRTKHRVEEDSKNDGQPCGTPHWRYYSQMSFLSEFVKKKSTPTDYMHLTAAEILARSDKNIFQQESFYIEPSSIKEESKVDSCLDSVDDIEILEDTNSSFHWNLDNNFQQVPSGNHKLAASHLSNTQLFSAPNQHMTAIKGDFSHAKVARIERHSSPPVLSSTLFHSSQVSQTEADDLFAKSIALTLSRFPARLKAATKVEIQKALLHAEEELEESLRRHNH